MDELLPCSTPSELTLAANSDFNKEKWVILVNFLHGERCLSNLNLLL